MVGKVKKEKRPAYMQQSAVQLQRAWHPETVQHPLLTRETIL